MEKVALFAFNGELMCFVHVLLNALDMKEKGYDVKLVIEGSATKLITELGESGKPFFKLFSTVKEKGLIDCICKACAGKMGTLKEAERQAIPLCDEMSGHPSMARYMETGHTVLTF